MSVPIWFTLTRIALPTCSSMPRRRKSTFVTKRSSPTSWTRPPRRSVSVCQPCPVVLAEAVLDRDDREAVAEVGPEVDHPGAVERAALALEPVDAVVDELARRGVERERDLVAVPGALGRLEDRLAGVVGGAEVGREAALVADARREAALAEEPLQVRGSVSAPIRSASEKLSAPAGTSMNSWKSSEFWAWAPPLTTFISGTGSTCALVPPSQR